MRTPLLLAMVLGLAGCGESPAPLPPDVERTLKAVRSTLKDGQRDVACKRDLQKLENALGNWSLRNPRVQSVMGGELLDLRARCSLRQTTPGELTERLDALEKRARELVGGDPGSTGLSLFKWMLVVFVLLGVAGYVIRRYTR